MEEGQFQEGQEDQVSLYMNPDARPDSSSFDDCEYSTWQKARYEVTRVCSFTTRIVGLVNHPAKVFNDHELVKFVRYPQCPYDKYSIKVFNSASVDVGYLHTQDSIVLSPLIDDRMISLDGEVTDSRLGDGKSIPCLVTIHAKSADVDRVKHKMIETRLTLTGKSRKDFESYKGKGVKEKSRVEKLGTLEPQKEVIKTKLLDHQKEGLWWLVNKENSDELPPFWELKNALYVNVLTRNQTKRRPEPLHGGIFADDFGLGKTLTLLSLIAFDKAGNVPEETGEKDGGLSVSVGRKRGRVSEKGMADQPSSASVAKQTLIVCPPAVCSAWKNQLQEHTQKGSLKLYKYYGNRTRDVEELKNYDIVLTTYGTLAIDYSERSSPLLKIEWWRVILDEAHTIKNAIAVQSQAISELTARRKWAVTGAPLQNGSFNLFGLMVFLRLDPLCEISYWQTLLERPLAKRNQKGFLLLQDLMATISLRRTKDKVLVGRLPSKTVATVRFKFSGAERELYDKMEAESKNVVRNLIDTDRLKSSYASVRCLVIQLRKICDDSALCSSYPESLLPTDYIGDASEHPESLRKMIHDLHDDEDFDCAICYHPPTDAVMTKCKHVFCNRCIRTYLQTTTTCPVCHRSILEFGLFAAPPESSNPGNPEKSSRIVSSKVSTLIKLLKESRAAKSVVFTTFQKMLGLLEEPLKDAGFNVLRLEPFTNPRRKDATIKEFGSAAQETVLLANVKISGAGINLTAASEVYLLEPWWDLAVEEQAVDRVHQYGQVENVRIFRLIAQDSIEERILEMQKRKKLAMEDFGRRQGPKERRVVSIEDLRGLLSL